MNLSESEYREETITNIIKLIEDEEYNCRCANGFKGAFTRDRKLNYKQLIVLISQGLKTSIQRDLDNFYREVNSTDFNIRTVSKSAFSQARAKLNPEAFIELNQNVNQTFYSKAPYLVWNNMRLLAVDGSRLVLPSHPSIEKEFGTHHFGPKADSKRSLALCSFLYDTLNLLTLDAQIAPYSCSERELLYKHLEKVKAGDLLLLDRGYPSIALFFLFKALGIEFCARMKDDWWLDVKQLNESGEKERIVKFKLPKKDQKMLSDFPQLFDQEIECRLVRIELDNGEYEILCTSLTDFEKFPYEDLSELYHHRWNIEEGFKLFKARIEVENFTGKTVRAVKQDFFAKVFMMSLCADLAFPIEDKVKKESKESSNKHPKKINRTSAFEMLRKISIGLFLKNVIKKALDFFDDIVWKTTEIVRPNRKISRKKKPKRLYHMNYKPL